MLVMGDFLVLVMDEVVVTEGSDDDGGDLSLGRPTDALLLFAFSVVVVPYVL